MTRLFILVCLVFVVIFNNTCQKNENPLNNMNPAPADSNQSGVLKSVLEQDLFMPDAVPEIVNNRALEICVRFNYSNIRILGVKNSAKPVFHIFYFRDDLKGLKAFTLDLNNDKTSIIAEQEVSLPYDDSKLHKFLTDEKCWKLAKIYSEEYLSGYSFQFSQKTTTYGWFHKVIDNLALSAPCSNENYSGNFDNSISSHRWEDDYFSPQGRIAHPICFHVFEMINRNQDDGKHYKFEDLLKSRDTRFEQTEPLGGYCHQVSEEQRYSHILFDDNTTLDNIVSSLDMFYRVFTPTSCH
jgi:hypothetical protein